MGVDPILIERWLAARDHVAMRETWTALPATLHPLGAAHRKLTLHGAAVLAEAMIGERADWLLARALPGGVPTYQDSRISDGAFLDHVWSVTGENAESLTIHERRDGLRGVQLVSISSGTVTGRPEGGGVIAVRIFDRDRAVSIPIDTYETIPRVAMIGEVDLAPLDLFGYSRPFVPTVDLTGIDAVRGVVARLAAEVDAHFDTSPSWAEGPNSVVPEWYQPDIVEQQTFVDGPRAVAIGLDRHGRRWAEALGLAWGQRFGFTLDAREGYLLLRFAAAELERIEARVASIGHF